MSKDKPQSLKTILIVVGVAFWILALILLCCCCAEAGERNSVLSSVANLEARRVARSEVTSASARMHRAISATVEFDKSCPACAAVIHITKTSTKILRETRATPFLIFEQYDSNRIKNWVAVQWYNGPLPACHQSQEGITSVDLGTMKCVFCKKNIIIMQRRIQQNNSAINIKDYCSLRIEGSEMGTADEGVGSGSQLDDAPPEYTRLDEDIGRLM